MPLSVGVVSLRHQRGNLTAAFRELLERGETVNQPNMILSCKLADLLGVLIEGVGRGIQLSGEIRRGSQKKHFNPFNLSLLDHRYPGFARSLQTDFSVVEGVIDGHDVRPMVQHLALDRPRTSS